MNTHEHVLHWLRDEIPAYLDKKGSVEAFIRDFNMDCASHYWYQCAIEVAIARWPKHRTKLESLRK